MCVLGDICVYKLYRMGFNGEPCGKPRVLETGPIKCFVKSLIQTDRLIEQRILVWKVVKEKNCELVGRGEGDKSVL